MALLLCVLLADAAPGAGIGSPVIIVNNVDRQAQSQEPRVLRVGIDVFADETVRTAEKSAARIVFQDQTKLEIGALSEVVLDRFVYDPNRSNSEVAVSIAKGIARFTTGVLRHESYKINTPAATIGVRGTVLNLRSRRARNVGLCRGRLGNGDRERRHGRGQCRASDLRPDRRDSVRPGNHAVASVRHDRNAGHAMGRRDARNNHIADAARHWHPGRDPE